LKNLTPIATLGRLAKHQHQTDKGNPMPRTLLLSVLNLQTTYQRVVEKLEEEKGDFDTLFLDFPAETTRYVEMIAQGAEHEEVLNDLREIGLLDEPGDVNLYKAATPLFEYLPELDPSVSLHCYREPGSWEATRKAATKVSLLTLRSRLRRRVACEEWLRILKDEITQQEKYVPVEARNIDKASGDTNICVCGLRPELLGKHLQALGHRVETLDLGISEKPLDLLRQLLIETGLDEKKIDKKLVRSLIEQHLRFVDNVLLVGYEKACSAWGRTIGGEQEQTYDGKPDKPGKTTHSFG